MKNRVLILDIETAPLEAYVWGLRDQNISLAQIKKDWFVMAWGAKWLDSKDWIYADQRYAKPMDNDKKILENLWTLLDQADIVITQNGKRFDAPRLNARFIMHGMRPPAPYRHLDTYQLVKQVAEFTSHKLEYLTDKLNTKYKKLHHSKFPGWSLWTECLNGNKAAWEEMKKYNIHDVLSTEELYNKIRAWAPETMPKVFNITDKARECSTCGHVGQMREGKPRMAKEYKYVQHSCLKCGVWQKGERIK